jgi:hypothetical protein
MLTGLLGTSACGGDSASAGPPTVVPKLTSVTLSPSPVELTVGQSTLLTAKAFDQSGAVIAGQSFTFASANIGIANVNSSGDVIGVSPGTTTITASAGSVSATASVNVTAPPVASLTVSPTTLSLIVGQTQKAVALAKDAAGNTLLNRAISWTIANGSIASVASDGTVTALALGSTTLTASSEGVKATSTVQVTSQAPPVFDYGKDLGITGSTRTLILFAPSVDPATRSASVNGVDTRALVSPFTFAWGDGSSTTGFFPTSHVYATATQNYVVRVTAHYSTTTTDSLDTVVRFGPAALVPVAFPAAGTVTIPEVLPALTSRQAGAAINPALQAVPNAVFSATLPRASLEYVLSQAATIELSILENDVEKVSGEWRQVVLYDPSFAGAYSIWYSSPIAFGAGTSFFSGVPGYSSLFHEMGHNLSLNAPAAFRYGGRIDGNANAIFSEAVAQMFQHTVAFELVNNAARYGIPPDLALDIAGSAHASAQTLQQLYDAYVSQGKPFTTWNDPATGVDETLGSFVAVARQFMLHAEQIKSYVGPLTRVMRLLRTFNASLAAQYAPQTNSATANTFRSTLMVAAVSYGFQQDLRAEFRALNFPIDDAVYTSLYAGVP